MRFRIKNTSVKRLARRAGIKSMSEDCYPLIRRIILAKLHEIAKTSLIVNSEMHTTSLMDKDVINALSFLGYNIGESNILCKDTHS